jgi:hypothetical protein
MEQTCGSAQWTATATVPGMSGRAGLAVVARIGTGLVIAGLVMLVLTYRMELPSVPLAVFLILVVCTTLVGVVLCVPFLEVGGRGFVLGPAAGKPGWLVATVCLVGGVGAWVAMVTSHGEADRVVIGMFTFFLSIPTIWCSGASRARAGTAATGDSGETGGTPAG